MKNGEQFSIKISIGDNVLSIINRYSWYDVIPYAVISNKIGTFIGINSQTGNPIIDFGFGFSESQPFPVLCDVAKEHLEKENNV